MKIGIYYKGIAEGSSEWGNWEQFLIELRRDNPDVEWEIVEDDQHLEGLT